MSIFDKLEIAKIARKMGYSHRDSYTSDNLIKIIPADTVVNDKTLDLFETVSPLDDRMKETEEEELLKYKKNISSPGVDIPPLLPLSSLKISVSPIMHYEETPSSHTSKSLKLSAPNTGEKKSILRINTNVLSARAFSKSTTRERFSSVDSADDSKSVAFGFAPTVKSRFAALSIPVNPENH